MSVSDIVILLHSFLSVHPNTHRYARAHTHVNKGLPITLGLCRDPDNYSLSGTAREDQEMCLGKADSWIKY